MRIATIAEALAQALQYHQAGDLPLAENLYRQILHADQANAPALHYLGILAHQRGQHQQALEYLRQARTLSPQQAFYHYNLGLVCQNLGQGEEAEASYRRALALRPDYCEALINLGKILAGTNPEQAVAFYHQALRLRPDLAEVHNDLGNILLARGQLDQASACYRKALLLRPNFPEACTGLGNVLWEQRQVDDAIGYYQQAISLRPGFPEAHYNLGIALQEKSLPDDAIASFRQAISLRADFAEAHNCLGLSFLDRGELDAAIACYRQAVHFRPDLVTAHNNLATALKDQGQMDQAIATFRHALELEPHHALVHGNLLYALPLCPDYDTRAICKELQRWNDLHAAPLASFLPPHDNERAPERRLRVGYVSPNFCMKPVGRFLLPLLEAHQHDSFEIYAYASVRAPDAMTERCRANCGVWRDVVGHTDEQLARVIRQDRIDILVDLTMHMKGSRLLAFARKPAPVQVTYLAYPGSSGLAVMDYRLTDPYMDPPGGADERFYAEQSIRLPETYWCYRPPLEAPAVAELPTERTGHVTFGCLNNFCKVSEPTLLAWTRLLQALPDACLLLHSKAGSHRQRVYRFLAEHQVAPERLTFVDSLSLNDYFRIHERIDVALDPFPHCGGTTTCDALWMGVPVVSLAGRTVVGRGGLSILSNLGLPDLVARDAEDYVRRALDLARELPRLSKLRGTLRERMLGSPLMDAPRFARNVEAAYRKMWRAWCENRQVG